LGIASSSRAYGLVPPAGERVSGSHDLLGTPRQGRVSEHVAPVMVEQIC
jgi:hypothetical protein